MKDEGFILKRVIVVNILILLMFAGISYWSQEKEKLETEIGRAHV